MQHRPRLVQIGRQNSSMTFITAAVPNPRICLPPGRGCQLGLISSARLLFSPSPLARTGAPGGCSKRAEMRETSWILRALAHSTQPRWHLAAAPPGQSAPSAAARRLLLLLLLATLPFLSQMSEDRITEMESGKDRGADGKIPYASGGRSCVIRTELHQRQPRSPLPRAGWRQCQQPGMQQQQLHLNQMPAHKADGAAADTGAAAKHRCRHARDAGYHAVDTDDDCQSNGQRRVQLHRVPQRPATSRRDPQLLQQQLQQPHYRRQPAPAQAACRGLRKPRPPPRCLLVGGHRRGRTVRPRRRGDDILVGAGRAVRTLHCPPSAPWTPGPVSLDPTQRLIDALETLRDSINDSTSVALQQSRVRNRRRAPQPARSTTRAAASRTTSAAASGLRRSCTHADAFIQAKWKEPLLEGRGAEELKSIDLEKYWNPLLYIDNILSETKEATWVVAQHDPLNSDVYIVERRRLKGVFLETLEPHDFSIGCPVQRSGRHPQDLTITITSERPDTEIELIPDEAEMSGINIQTFWRLHEHIEVEKRTLTQEFSSTMKSHPCLAVRCRAARRPGYFYWNVFLIMVSLCESGPEFGSIRFI
uniref:START domain-containing protein n=1 Tax=Macrostomum lignano TaxID=282301 RepID=A0A1I8FDW6_9PLAT